MYTLGPKNSCTIKTENLFHFLKNNSERLIFIYNTAKEKKLIPDNRIEIYIAENQIEKTFLRLKFSCYTNGSGETYISEADFITPFNHRKVSKIRGIEDEYKKFLKERKKVFDVIEPTFGFSMDRSYLSYKNYMKLNEMYEEYKKEHKNADNER